MVLLSFDTEEFDLPREHGVDLSLEEAMIVSVTGTNIILDILKEFHIKATFFCTTNFAENAPLTIKRIVEEGHEIASHGCDHWHPQETDVAESKQILEKITGKIVQGYRQPRMFIVSDENLEKQGYLYNSSLHPAFIPGRYMHLNESRIPYLKGNLLEIPASVSPIFRIPVFWLACHNYPFWLYKILCKWTYRYDGQFVIYFHPWEFINLNIHPEWRIPFIIRHNSGEAMQFRLRKLINTFLNRGYRFETFVQFATEFLTKKK